MSILIKGMEMPETCQGCPLNVSIYTYDGGDNMCALQAWYGWFEEPKNTRHPDCPLGPLPAGHGRLIDADALCAGLVSNNPVVIYVKNAPTIVPAEGVNADG